MEVSEHLPREGMLRSRRQLYALGVLATLVLLVMVLYGWRLYSSLAERELEALTEDTRNEAERVAEFLRREVDRAQGNLVLSLTTGSSRAVLDVGLASRAGVARVVVRDATGVELAAIGSGGGRVLDPDERQRTSSGDLGPRGSFEVPIGSYGSLHVLVDAFEVDRRQAALRATMATQATSLMVVVILLFGLGGAAVRRNYVGHRAALERASHTERMAYIGTLAAGLAHEIRSPLNSLSLNMQMLDEEVARVSPGSSGRRLLEITSAEIARLESLVDEFLNYARPRPMAMEEVRARDLVDRAVEIVRGSLEAKGVEVRIEDHSASALVRVDPNEMHQLLLNLTENASHATDGIRRPAWIEYLLEADEDYVRVKVHDNGRGMLEEDLRQATEIFYSRRKGGTGLGLAIVERIVKSHGGRLEIESEVQVGTTVTVELPAVATSGATSRSLRRDRAAAAAESP